MALLAVASAGLLGGHSLTYLRLAPSASSRTIVLEATGHGYLETVMVLVGALGLMSALFWLADGAIRSRDPHPSLLSTAFALGLVQIAGFGAQELLERVVAGASLQDLGSVMLIGLPIQVMVATVAALIVTVLHNAGKRIAVFLSRPRPAPACSPPVSSAPSVHFSSAVPAGGLRTRGPPLLLS